MEQINLSGFAKGIYYLRMNTGTETRIHKVVIQ
ncbi:MAG: T9SS type A sorting domain-containing protein [Bacteroidales bacterium]|nr:T9SS type A sorting domain-containing protein [Bacteroidales bacterium]